MGISYDSTVAIETVARALYEQLFYLNKILVIINDVESYEKVKELLPPCLASKREPCCCILTSQYRITESDTHFPFHSKTLHKFKKEDALQYCQAILGQKVDQTEDYKLLAKKLKYYPLALAQAVSTISHGASVEDYLEAYEEDNIGALSQIKLSENYSKTVLIALLTNVINIGSQSMTALKLLCQCAYLSASNLTDDLLEMLIGNTIQTREAINCLINFSILIPEYEESNRTYRIHELLQQLLRLWLEKKLIIKDSQFEKSVDFIREKVDGNTDLFDNLLESLLVYSRFQNGGVTDILRRIALLPHLKSLLSYANEWKEANLKLLEEREIKIAELYEAIAMILEYAGGFQLQSKLLYEVVYIWKKYKGENSREVAMALNNLALALGNIGRRDGMLPNLQKALLIHQACDAQEGKPNYATAAAHINLAVSYDKSGDLDLVIPELKCALSIQEKIFSPMGWPVCISKINLAIAYGKKGKFKRKKQLLKEAMKIQNKSGRNKWQPLEIATRINYANVLGELRNKKKREAELLKLLNYFPYDKHPLKVSILVNLASAQESLGKHDKRLETLDIAIQLQQEIFGDHHPETEYIKRLREESVIPSYDVRATKYADPQPAQTSKCYDEFSLNRVFYALIDALGLRDDSQGSLEEQQKKVIEYKKRNELNYFQLCKAFPIIQLLIEKLHDNLLINTHLKVYMNGLYDVCWAYIDTIKYYEDKVSPWAQVPRIPPVQVLVVEVLHRLRLYITQPNKTKSKTLYFQQAFTLLIQDLLCARPKKTNKEKNVYEIQQLDTCANILALTRKTHSEGFFEAAFQLLVDNDLLKEKSFEEFFLDFWKKCLENRRCYSFIMKNHSFQDLDDRKTKYLSPDKVLDKLKKQMVWRNEVLTKCFSFFTGKHCGIITSDKMAYYKLQPSLEKISGNIFSFGYVVSQSQYYLLKFNAMTTQDKTIFFYLGDKNEEWINFQHLSTNIKEVRESEKEVNVRATEIVNLSTTNDRKIDGVPLNINLLEKKEMGKKDEEIKKSKKSKATRRIHGAEHAEVQPEKPTEVLTTKKHKKKSGRKAEKSTSDKKKSLEHKIPLTDNEKVERKKEMLIVAQSEPEAGMIPKIARPVNCRELSQYYPSASDIEKIHLSQQITGWINRGDFPLREDTWQDAIELLNTCDKGISDTWLQKIYTEWRTNFAQGDWIRTVLTTTLLRLQYFQPGILSEGGAVTIMSQMLDWIDDAEGLLGVIPMGAIAAWENVLAITSLLSLSFDQEVGVGKKVYEKFLKLLLKLKTNLTQLENSYEELEASYKKCIEKKEKGFELKDEAERYENEQKLATLPKQIEDAKLKYQRLEQLSAALEANRKIMEINWTRLQKLNAYGDALSNAFKTVVGVVTASATAAAGTSILAASIVAAPVSCGAAALAIIPAAAGFSASIIGAGGILYQAAWSAGAAGLTLHELWRNADEHPINKMFSNEIDDNVLASIKAHYLDANGNLKKGVKRDDSWHLVQFLRELLVNLQGAAALKEELKMSVVEGLRQLLSAIYRAHAKSKHNLSNTICLETVAITQTLQECFQLDMLNTGQERPSNLIVAYESQGWLPKYKKPKVGLLGPNKEEFNIQHQKKLSGYLDQYRARVRAVADQPNIPIGLPWYDWFYDLSVEQLAAAYEEYKADNKQIKTLTSTYASCVSFVPLAQKKYRAQSLDHPILSSCGLNLAESLLSELEKLPEMQNKEEGACGIDIKAKAAHTINAVSFAGKVKIRLSKVATVINAQQLEKVLNDKGLNDKHKIEIIEMHLSVVESSQPTPAERNVFTVMHNSEGLPSNKRVKLILKAMESLQHQNENIAQGATMEKKQEILRKEFTTANKLFNQFLRNFGSKAPTEGTWTAYDEAEAAFNALKFTEGVNDVMRIEIDKKISSLEQYSAKYTVM